MTLTDLIGVIEVVYLCDRIDSLLRAYCFILFEVLNVVLNVNIVTGISGLGS